MKNRIIFSVFTSNKQTCLQVLQVCWWVAKSPRYPPPHTPPTPPLNGNIQAIRKAHTATGFSGEPPSAAGLPLSIDTLRGRSLIFKVNNLSSQAETSREPESGDQRGFFRHRRFLREKFTIFKFLAVKTTWLNRTREVKVSLIREVAFSSWFTQETRGIVINASGIVARCCQVAITATNNSISLTFTIRSYIHKTHHVVTQSGELSEGVARKYGWHSDLSCLFSCRLLWFRRS